MTALLRLKITPNAPTNAVLGETDGVIRLKLQAPAVEGKANAALVAFLAETLQVPKAVVSLKGGRRSRLKQVEVQGLHGAEAWRRLLAPANKLVLELSRPYTAVAAL
jgi:uncharacterized protein (TIGR00251 family)